MITPSSHARISACLASVVLPQSKSVGPRAVRGTELHAFLASVAKDGLEEALENIPLEWRAAAQAIDLTRLPELHPEAGIPEVAMAWNPETGEARELGRNGTVEHEDLAELVKPGEMAGIADYITLTPSDVVVFDWKFGYQSVERADVNRQLGAYACMAGALYGRERATVYIARILDDGSVWLDPAHLDELSLDAHAARLRKDMRRVEEAKLEHRNRGTIPSPMEGAHCRYCPAFNACPAKVALLLSTLTGKEPAALAQLPEPLTLEMASALWPKLKQAEALIERLKDNLKDFARLNGPIPLPNGNVLAEGESTKESINALYARETLYKHFGAEDTEMNIESSITKKAFDELCGKHSSHGKKAALVRKVMTELGEAGALRSFTVRSVQELKPTSKRLKASNDPD
jgi:hypothetical protein